MLAQDKETLKAHLHTQALHIRERELNLFHDSLATVGTQAALFAGFAFGAFIEFEIPEGTAQSLIGTFAVISIATLVLNINCVVHAISVCVWGPGLALRGTSSSSMINAVEAMKEERLVAFQVGFLGTMGIQLAACVMSFIAFEPITAWICSVVLISSIFITLHTIVRVRRRFAGEHDPTALHSLFDGRALPTLKGSFLSRADDGRFITKDNEISFDEVSTSQNGGPPLCSHSGYLFRKRGSTKTSSERLFFVLYEKQLWCYRHRKGWQIREAPHELIPLQLQDFILRETVEANVKGPPREAILSAIRKQVTGDGDVRITDYLVDSKLRSSIRNSATVREKNSISSSVHSEAAEQTSTSNESGLQLSAKKVDVSGDPSPSQEAALKFQLFPVKVLESVMVEFRAESMQEKKNWIDALTKNSTNMYLESQVERALNNGMKS